MPIGPIEISARLENPVILERNNRIALRYARKTGHLPIVCKRKIAFSNVANGNEKIGPCSFLFVCDDQFNPIASRIVHPFTRAKIVYGCSNEAEGFFMREMPDPEVGEELEFRTRAKISGDNLEGFQCFVFDDDSDVNGEWYPFPESEHIEVANTLEEQKYRMTLYFKAALVAAAYTRRQLNTPQT